MPTVLRIGAFRFFFYANEGQEPVHIHVQADNMLAKFWLQPVNLASSIGFNAKQLNQLLGLVRENETLFLEAWNDFFNIKC
jgi:ABC-type long-subunit fatty acid transport system fused permease/ATPase subunit